jgi:NAD(P)-dependent dehydrogenase (short-subunit alcohol dehydrogenase family)
MAIYRHQAERLAEPATTFVPILMTSLHGFGAEFGPVDVLVNNAGYAVWKPLEATTRAEWDHTFALKCAGCRLPVRCGAARHAGAPVRPGDQHRQRGRRRDRAGPGQRLKGPALAGPPDQLTDGDAGLGGADLVRQPADPGHQLPAAFVVSAVRAIGGIQVSQFEVGSACPQGPSHRSLRVSGLRRGRGRRAARR